MHYAEPQSAVQPLQHVAAFIREGFVTLNPAQANVVLRECQYDRQRRVDKDHVAVLAELMRRGLWERKDKLDFARLNGRLILVNGYHRMTAQASTGKSVEWTVVIHDVASEADVRNIYHRFDTNVRKRSDENILGGVDFAGQSGLPAVWAKALFGAAPIITNGLLAGGVSRGIDAVFAKRIVDDRLAVAREFVPAALALAEALAPAPDRVKTKVRMRTVCSVALVTMRSHPDAGAEFWGGMALNDGLRRGDPRQALLNDLLNRNFHSGLVQQGIAVPSLAWNAFWERRDLKIIKVAPDRSFRLLGTPYTVRT